MNYFFGYDNYLPANVNWMFNLNHLFLVFFIVGFLSLLFFALNAKSEKGKKITKLCLAGVLLVLEIARIVYNYCLHVHVNSSGLNFNWWWQISFQMCTIMVWFTIATLIVSAFVKKDNIVLKYMLNIVLGVAMIGALLTFVYPDLIHENRPFLHFVNIQTIVTHALLIFVPIYLFKIKELKVSIKDAWMPLVGYLMVNSISLTASQISGNNFAYALNCDLLKDLGINIAYPWHIILVLAVVYLVTLAIYGIFIGINALQNRKNKDYKIAEKKRLITNKKYYIVYLSTLIGAIVLGFILNISLALAFSPLGSKTWVGLVCLIPLVIMVSLLVVAEIFKKKSTKIVD